MRHRWPGTFALQSGTRITAARPRLLAAADVVAYIPQVGKVGSLNVAAATAIALAEVRRRDWAGEPG